MKYRIGIYIELLTQVQDNSLLSLLYFPQAPIMPPTGKMRVKKLACGATQIMSVSNIEQIIKKAESERNNELSVTYRFPFRSERGRRIVIHKIHQRLDISPTSELWASDKSCSQTEVGKDNQAIKTSQSKEYFLKWNQVDCYPSCLHTFIELEGLRTVDQVAEWLPEELMNSIPDNLNRIKVFGAAHYGLIDSSTTNTPPNILTNLSMWPKSYPILGDRFDLLHPIMIGSCQLGKRIKHLFHNEVRLLEKVSIGNADKLCVVSLSTKALETHLSEKDTKAILVSKDLTTAREEAGNPTQGEFRIGTSLYYIQRRYNELVVNDRISRLKGDLQRLPVLSAKYCNMLGIDELDVLLDVRSIKINASEQQKIDDAFSEVENNLPIRIRVWNAHIGIWQKRRYSQELLDLINTMFF